ncbi:unnamed protein product, partial [Brassica oleracea]
FFPNAFDEKQNQHVWWFWVKVSTFELSLPTKSSKSL